MTNGVIEQISKQVYSFHSSDTSGHDWCHVSRVWKLARYIAEKEGANFFLVELAALLHDIDDHKIEGADSINLPNAKRLLRNHNVDSVHIERVVQIIKEVSFKGACVEAKTSSIEACVVQDADRLDAIGAIGIARAFTFGGSKKRELYHPEIHPKLHDSFEEYKNAKGTTLNHFYEKLLLLKDRLNTQTAKDIALDRHSFMEQFLERFLAEWYTKDFNF